MDWQSIMQYFDASTRGYSIMTLCNDIEFTWPWYTTCSTTLITIISTVIFIITGHKVRDTFIIVAVKTEVAVNYESNIQVIK